VSRKLGRYFTGLPASVESFAPSISATGSTAFLCSELRITCGFLAPVRLPIAAYAAAAKLARLPSCVLRLAGPPRLARSANSSCSSRVASCHPSKSPAIKQSAQRRRARAAMFCQSIGFKLRPPLRPSLPAGVVGNFGTRARSSWAFRDGSALRTGTAPGAPIWTFPSRQSLDLDQHAAFRPQLSCPDIQNPHETWTWLKPPRKCR
jgi:hypothetical protein